MNFLKWWRSLSRKGNVSEEMFKILSDPRAKRELETILRNGSEDTVTTTKGKTYRVTRSQPREKASETVGA